MMSAFKGLAIPFALAVCTLSAFANDNVIVRKLTPSSDSLRVADVVLFGPDGQMTTFTEDDIKIWEDGEEVTEVSVKCPEKDTAEILVSSVLALDVSGSMKAGAPNLLLAKEAAKAWIQALSEGSECALTTFDHESNVLLDYTNDKQRLVSALDNLIPNGGTDFNNAFSNLESGALPLASEGKHRRVLVFLTDGNGMVAANRVANFAKQNKITVYCVSLGEPMPTSLKRITESTGGLWFHNVTSVQQAKMAYRRIYADATGAGGCIVRWRPTASCSPIQNVVVRVADGEWSTALPLPRNQRKGILASPTTVSFEREEMGRKYVSLTAKGAPTTINSVAVDRTDIVSVSADDLPYLLVPGDTLRLRVNRETTDTSYQIARISVEAEPCRMEDVYISIGDVTSRPDAPTLRVKYPNGGERFPIRSRVDLEWEGLPPNVPVRVEVSVDGGRDWRIVSPQQTGLKRRWVAPKLPSDSCLLRVTHLLDQNKKPEPLLTIPGGRFVEAKFSPNGKYIVSSSADSPVGSSPERPELALWDASSGALIKDLGVGRKMEFNGSGDLLVSWDDGGVQAYQLPKGDLLWSYPTTRGILLCEVSNDGRTVLVAGGPGDSTCLFNGTTGEHIRTLPRNADRIYWATMSDDGKLVATSEYDASVMIRNVETGELVASISEDGVQRFFSCSFSPDGNILAVTTSHAQASLYNASTGAKLHDISSRRFVNDNTYLTFSSDGDRIAVESGEDKTSIIAVSTGQPLVSMKRANEIGGALGAGFIGNNELMFVNMPHKVSVFDAFTGVQVADFARVSGIASTPAEGGRIVVIDPNSNIQVYSLASPLLQQDVSDGFWSIYQSEASMKDVDFGTIAVGQSRDSNVVGLIVNRSERDTVRVTSVNITGSSALEFSHSLPSEFMIAPQDSVAFNIAFHPSTEGEKLATIALGTDAGRLAGRLTGSTPPGVLGAKSGRFDIGRNAIGAYAYQEIDSFFVNTGDKPLRITSMTVVGPNDSSFVLDSIAPLTIQPKKAKTVGVTFIPQEPGRTFTRVAIQVDGLDDPVYATITALADTGVFQPPTGEAEFEPDPITDPTTFRSIMLPTAVIPEEGTITTGVYDVVGLAATYSVTDFLAVQAGGVIPIPTRWFGVDSNATVSGVWSLGARVGFEVAEDVIVGGGYQTGQSYYDLDRTEGLDSKITFHGLWATGGYGDDDSRLNAYLGYALKDHNTIDQGSFSADAFIYGLAYDYRIAHQWKLSSEVVFMRSMEFVPITITARYFRETDAFEIGFAFIGIPASGATAPSFPFLPVLSWVKRW